MSKLVDINSLLSFLKKQVKTETSTQVGNVRSEYDKKISSLNSQLTTANNSIKTKDSTITNLNSTINTQKNQLTQKDQTIASLQAQIQSLQNQPPAEKLAKMTKVHCNLRNDWGSSQGESHFTVPTNRTDLQLWTSLIPCVTSVRIGVNASLAVGEWCGLNQLVFNYDPATKDFYVKSYPDTATKGNGRKAEFGIDIYYTP